MTRPAAVRVRLLRVTVNGLLSRTGEDTHAYGIFAAGE